MIAPYRFSFCGRYQGQPNIAGYGNATNVVMAGLSEQTTGTATWTLEDSARDNYGLPMHARGDAIAVLDQEGSLDTTRLARVARGLSAYGISSWWFAPSLSWDGSAGVGRDADPVTYRAWRAQRLAITLPPGLNAAFGMYAWLPGFLDGSTMATQMEQAFAYRDGFGAARVMPLVWSHYNDGHRTAVPVFLFRSLVRLSILVFGRVMLWIDPTDGARPWGDAVAHDPYLAAYAEESGIPLVPGATT